MAKKRGQTAPPPASRPPAIAPPTGNGVSFVPFCLFPPLTRWSKRRGGGRAFTCPRGRKRRGRDKIRSKKKKRFPQANGAGRERVMEVRHRGRPRPPPPPPVSVSRPVGTEPSCCSCMYVCAFRQRGPSIRQIGRNHIGTWICWVTQQPTESRLTESAFCQFITTL